MHVLLAVDHSPASDSAVAYLRALPFGRSVDLQVVTAVAPISFGESRVTAETEIAALLDEERRHAESTLSESLEQFHDGEFRSLDSEVRIGSPGQELTEVAERHGADLVVMGAVGRSALERVLLGSVSEYVANHTQSSVLIVRSRKSKGAPTETIPRRVMLALDNTGQDPELANWLRRLELPASTEVHLVHVMQSLTYYRQDLIQQMTKSWQQSKAAAEAHAESLSEVIRGWGFEAIPRVIAAAHVADELISYADEHGCDLIVTGDRRRGSLKRWFLGSVSRHVLRYAACNVLVSRGGPV